jgi:hypothetical protein
MLKKRLDKPNPIRAGGSPAYARGEAQAALARFLINSSPLPSGSFDAQRQTRSGGVVSACRRTLISE